MDNQNQDIRKMLEGNNSLSYASERVVSLDNNTLKPLTYKGPDSFAEAMEIVRKHQGKSLAEIPFNERLGYAVIELIVPREGNPLGVQEQTRLIARAIEWGGFHIEYANKGVVESSRLDDNSPTIMQVVFNLPNIPILESYLRGLNVPVVRMGVVSQALVQYVELDQINKQASFLASQLSGEEIQQEETNAFKFKGLALANVFIDTETIEVTAGLSNISSEDMKGLKEKLFTSQQDSFNLYRRQRLQEVMNMQNPTPSIDQAEGIGELDIS